LGLPPLLLSQESVGAKISLILVTKAIFRGSLFSTIKPETCDFLTAIRTMIIFDSVFCYVKTFPFNQQLPAPWAVGVFRRCRT
jgi:hypothetical protein